MARTWLTGIDMGGQKITNLGTPTARGDAIPKSSYVDGLPPTSLTYGATINTDVDLSNYFRVTLTGNATLAAPTNATDGQRVMWELTASGGPWTVTLATGATGAFKFGTSITTLGPVAAGTTTFLGCVYRSTSQRWHVLAVSEGH